MGEQPFLLASGQITEDKGEPYPWHRYVVMVPPTPEEPTTDPTEVKHG